MLNPLRNLAVRLLGRETGALARDAVFVFGIRLIGAAAVFVTQILLARWAGAETLGLYSYAFAWCILLSIIAGVGWPNAAYRVLSRALADGRKDLMAGFVRRGRQVLLGSSAIVIAVGAVALFAPGTPVPAEQRTPLLLALIAVPFYGLMRQASGIAHSLTWWHAAFLPDLAIRPLLLLCAIVAARAGGLPLTAATVMGWQLAVILLVAAGQTAYVAVHWKPQIGVPSPSYATSDWLHTAWPLLFVALFTNFFMELNLIVAGHFLAADELGVFTAAFRTAFLIGFGIFAVDAIMLPRAAQAHARGRTDDLQRLLSQATWVKTTGSLAAIAVMVPFGRPLLAIFGAEFVPGYGALLVLALAQLVIAMVGPVAQLLSVSGHQRACLVVLPVSIAVTIGLNSLLIPRYGVNGAALTVLLVVVLQSAWLYRVVVQRLRVHSSVFALWRP